MLLLLRGCDLALTLREWAFLLVAALSSLSAAALLALVSGPAGAECLGLGPGLSARKGSGGAADSTRARVWRWREQERMVPLRVAFRVLLRAALRLSQGRTQTECGRGKSRTQIRCQVAADHADHAQAPHGARIDRRRQGRTRAPWTREQAPHDGRPDEARPGRLHRSVPHPQSRTLCASTHLAHTSRCNTTQRNATPQRPGPQRPGPQRLGLPGARSPTQGGCWTRGVDRSTSSPPLPQDDLVDVAPGSRRWIKTRCGRKGPNDEEQPTTHASKQASKQASMGAEGQREKRRTDSKRATGQQRTVGKGRKRRPKQDRRGRRAAETERRRGQGKG